ncbi:MAG: isocitrate lyase/phosphoenolpyruvate mutase family protein [Betaproteobacteria bacterium]|nr:isocitrate lyase/phosphoenolpyruvate mutase family protein [Betaproteobacteria bacterium]
MNHTDQRNKLRALMAESKCRSPASVFDPLSARVAEAVGFEIGMLAGSVASNTTLAAPDLIVLTLTEFADQVRRIMRVSKLSLLVDADHGYGNALNVMRTVQELEHAGVSALSIEDTVLPKPFGQAEGKESLTSIEEGIGKLRAAVAARSDPSLIVAGRTSALKVEGVEGAIARAKAYAAAGVDAIFIVGLEKLEQLDAIHAAVTLPIIVGSAPASLKREDLAARGARILLQGHQPVAAAVKALHETYMHLYHGGAPADLKSKIASPQEMERLIDGESYKQWQREYLR